MNSSVGTWETGMISSSGRAREPSTSLQVPSRQRRRRHRLFAMSEEKREEKEKQERASDDPQALAGDHLVVAPGAVALEVERDVGEAELLSCFDDGAPQVERLRQLVARHLD